MQHTTAGQNVYAANELHIHEAARASLSLRHQLPSPPANFTGREEDLAELEKELAAAHSTGANISGRHAGLQGMGGVGKTALATVLAHRLKDHYPDAQLYLNLRGADPEHRPPVAPADAMQSIIHVFHPEAKLPEALDQLTPVYHGVLNEAGRVLLFLDNVADAEQVRPLLPPANCLVLVTSRNHFSLPGMVTRDIDCMRPEKSQEFLLKMAPRIKGHEKDAAELCGHLPLALEVFAGAVNDKNLYSVPDLLDRLVTRQERLNRVEAAFQISYELLGSEMQKCWSLLSVFSPSFDLHAVAAVWDEEARYPAATDHEREAMQMLVNANLVKLDKITGKFRLHDLVRCFCDGKLSKLQRNSASLRYSEHYKRIIDAASALLKQGGESMLRGLEMFDCDREHLEAAFEKLHSRSDRGAAAGIILLVNAVSSFYKLRFHPIQQLRWAEAQRDAGRFFDDKEVIIIALRSLGNAYNGLGYLHKTIEHYQQALEISRGTSNREEEGRVLIDLGGVYVELGDAQKAIEYCEQGLVVARAVSDRQSEHVALDNLHRAYELLGDTQRAIEFHQQSLKSALEIHNGGKRADSRSLAPAQHSLGDPHNDIDLAEQGLLVMRKIGDRFGEGEALLQIGNAYYFSKDMIKAVEFYDQALAIYREIGDRSGEGKVFFNLGSVNYFLGNKSKAIEFYAQALVICREIGNRKLELAVLDKLGLAHTTLDDARKAIEFYEQHLNIAREIGDRRVEGNALCNLGVAYKKLGDVRKAIEFYEQYLTIAREIGDRLGEGNALWNSALAHDSLGNRAEAIPRAGTALKIYEAIEDPNAAQVRAQLAEWRGQT